MGKEVSNLIHAHHGRDAGHTCRERLRIHGSEAQANMGYRISRPTGSFLTAGGGNGATPSRNTAFRPLAPSDTLARDESQKEGPDWSFFPCNTSGKTLPDGHFPAADAGFFPRPALTEAGGDG